MSPCSVETVAEPRNVETPVVFEVSTSTPTLDFEAMSATAASVRTMERVDSPVFVSMTPTMSFTSERFLSSPGAPPGLRDVRCTSKSVSGRMR